MIKKIKYNFLNLYNNNFISNFFLYKKIVNIQTNQNKTAKYINLYSKLHKIKYKAFH